MPDRRPDTAAGHAATADHRPESRANPPFADGRAHTGPDDAVSNARPDDAAHSGADTRPYHHARPDDAAADGAPCGAAHLGPDTRPHRASDDDDAADGAGDGAADSHAHHRVAADRAGEPDTWRHRLRRHTRAQLECSATASCPFGRPGAEPTPRHSRATIARKPDYAGAGADSAATAATAAAAADQRHPNGE